VQYVFARLNTFLVFSERELPFTFAICYRCYVCLSVTFVHPTQPVEIFVNFSLVPWPSIDIHRKFYEDCPRAATPLGGLNARGVAKNSDF